MWFVGVEVEQETSAPPPKKNPGSAPDIYIWIDSCEHVFHSLSVYGRPSFFSPLLLTTSKISSPLAL